MQRMSKAPQHLQMFWQYLQTWDPPNIRAIKHQHGLLQYYCEDLHELAPGWRKTDFKVISASLPGNCAAQPASAREPGVGAALQG